MCSLPTDANGATHFSRARRRSCNLVRGPARRTDTAADTSPSDFLALWQPYLAILWRQLIRFGYSSPSTYGWSSDADGQERIKKAKQYLRKLDPATRQAAPSV